MQKPAICKKNPKHFLFQHFTVNELLQLLLYETELIIKNTDAQHDNQTKIRLI